MARDTVTGDEVFGRIRHYTSPSASWWGRDMKRLLNNETWTRYVGDRLTAGELQRLEGLFGSTLESFAAAAKGNSPKRWTAAQRDWILDVLAIDVDLKPSGRAVLRAPAPPPGRTTYAGYRVELHWLYDRASRSPRLVSAHVIADEYLDSFHEPLVIDSRYFAAFELAHQRARAPLARAPRRRPKPGVVVEPDFYVRLLDAYDALVAEACNDPAAELARRMDANHSTVKSWLRRGRIYLQGGKP